MDKTIFYEDFILGEIDFKVSKEIISESLKKKSGRLEVILPVGYVDRPTGNHRIYEKKELTEYFKKIKNEMKTGAIHGAHGKHPETFFVPPNEISHLITEAWIEDDFIYNKWLVLNTANGKDLAELFLSGAKIGVSIRGRGIEVPAENKNNFSYIREYEYGGTDTVGLPSTGIMAGINVPKVEIRLLETQEQLEACRCLLESFEENLELSSGEISKEDGMEGLKELIENLTKVVNSLNEKSQNDELKSILEKVESARKVESDKIVELEKLLKVKQNQCSYLKEALLEKDSLLRKNNRTIYQIKEKDIELISSLKEYASMTNAIIEEMRQYCYKLEDVVEELIDVTRTSGKVGDSLKGMVLSLREEKSYLITSLQNQKIKLEDYDNRLKELKENTKPINIVDKSIHNSVGVYLRKYPMLLELREELYQSRTVTELRNRVLKYLKFKGFNAVEDIKVINQSITTKTPTNLKAIPGWK